MNISTYSKKCIEYMFENNMLNEIQVNNIISDSANNLSQYSASPNNIFFNSIHSLIPKIFDKSYKYRLVDTKIIYKNKNKQPLLYEFMIHSKLIDDMTVNEFIIKQRNKNIIVGQNDQNKFIKYVNDLYPDKMLLNNLLYDNLFIGIDIQYYCENTDLIMHKYVDKLNSEITIFENIDEKHKINVAHVYKIINMIQTLTEKKNKVSIFIINTPMTKKYTFSGLVGVDNINSGMTITGEKIVIWRYEEIYKVLIHELLHYYDFYIDDNLSVQKILNVRCVKCQNYINEAYVELFALLIHTKLIEYLLNYRYSFVSLISYEYSFSLFQIAKALIFFDINTSKCIIKQDECKPIVQTTSFFSYFIIKSLFLHNINSILQNPMNNIDKLLHNFLNNSAKFYDDINKNISLLKKMKVNMNDKKNNFILKTFRMTCLEIDI